MTDSINIPAPLTIWAVEQEPDMYSGEGGGVDSLWLTKELADAETLRLKTKYNRDEWETVEWPIGEQPLAEMTIGSYCGTEAGIEAWQNRKSITDDKTLDQLYAMLGDYVAGLMNRAEARAVLDAIKDWIDK